MKKVIKSLIVLIVLGLVACVSNSTKAFAIWQKGYHDKFSDEATYINTFYDSKNRPHKIIVFEKYKGITCVDLDANTYK